MKTDIYTNNNISLVSASLGKSICDDNDYLMTDFKPISKYKLDELQKIAKALDIKTTVERS